MAKQEVDVMESAVRMVVDRRLWRARAGAGRILASDLTEAVRIENGQCSPDVLRCRRRDG